MFVYNLPEITENALRGVYDYEYYISHEPTVRDLTGGDREKSLQFFFNYGMSIGHQGSEEFDPWKYRQEHPELAEKYGDDMRSYYYDYLQV